MNEPQPNEYRVVRAPLPLDLIRSMDKAILERRGGLESRAELIKEAIEAFIAELIYPPAEPVPTTGRSTSKSDSQYTPEVAGRTEAGPLSLSVSNGLQFTALRLPRNEPSVLNDTDVPTEPDDSLFGLHNRDYPSIWAAFKLFQLGGPVLLPDARKRLVMDAWSFADELTRIDPTGGAKRAALFPKNHEKPDASADTFFSFGVGYISRTEHGLQAIGPLYQWNVCALQRDVNGDFTIGLTPDGIQLCRQLEGLSLELPHSPEHADHFLSHLKRFAPGDWLGFSTVLNFAGGATRSEVVEAFTNLSPQWTENVASTNAAGYIARAREWGLVEPKLSQGKYLLTQFGAELSSTMEGSSR